MRNVNAIHTIAQSKTKIFVKNALAILGTPNHMGVVHVVQTVRIIYVPLMIHALNVEMVNMALTVNGTANPFVKITSVTEMAVA